MTKGVSNIDMTAAYAAIANKGVYTKPIYYTQVLDSEGNVLIDNSIPETHKVLKESSAWLLTSGMESVVSSGTATRAKVSNQPTAGKTGTTQFDTDIWFCGFTPYYTASIWVGYDDNSRTVSSINHTSIWRAIMEQVHEGLPSGSFEQPDDIVQVAVCSKSGKLPVEGLCDSDPRGSCIITEYFAADNQPTEQCDTHVKVTICNDSGDVANTGCTNVTTKILTKKPSSDSLGSSESGYSTRDAERTSSQSSALSTSQRLLYLQKKVQPVVKLTQAQALKAQQLQQQHQPLTSRTLLQLKQRRKQLKQRNIINKNADESEQELCINNIHVHFHPLIFYISFYHFFFIFGSNTHDAI